MEHFSIINGETGCFAVNGTGDDNKPIVFYLEYIFVNHLWQISDIDVSFPENTDDFKKAALCPKSVRVRWLVTIWSIRALLVARLLPKRYMQKDNN